MKVDFSKWGLLAPNDDTGLGRMAQDIKSVLPLGRHLVATSERLPSRPLAISRDLIIPKDCGEFDLRRLMEGLHGLIFFERHSWHPQLLKLTRESGIRTVCVPMWEWFDGNNGNWDNCDFFACPNKRCLEVVRSYGYKNSAVVTWPLDLGRFPARSVSGAARAFVHNAGMIDPDDRKGTGATIRAFERTKASDIRLTIRCQKPAEVLASKDPRISLIVGNATDPADLYRTGDVFIQPSKLEGLGFMVLEAVASGVPVITLDRPPMNEWVQQSELLVSARPFRYPAYSSAWIPQSHLRLPSIGELTRVIEWASENDLSECSSANRRWAVERFDRGRLYSEWMHRLGEVLARPMGTYVQPSGKSAAPCQSLGWRIRSKLEELTGRQIPLLGK